MVIVLIIKWASIYRNFIMRTYLIFFVFIFSFSINAQKNIEAKELTRKEIRQLKAKSI